MGTQSDDAQMKLRIDKIAVEKDSEIQDLKSNFKKNENRCVTNRSCCKKCGKKYTKLTLVLMGTTRPAVLVQMVNQPMRVLILKSTTKTHRNKQWCNPFSATGRGTTTNAQSV